MNDAGSRMASLARHVVRRAWTAMPRTFALDGRSLSLPAGHLVDWYRFRHRRYDEPVADLCAVLAAKYGSFEAIDIGANVGTTAALMAREGRVRVLCVEGNAKYIPYLARNLARISPSSEIAACYVGAGDGEIAGAVRTRSGTAAIEIADSAGSQSGTVRLRSLATILDEHASFRAARLVKVDTDGFDAKIVVGALETLARMRPLLYVEYSPVGPPEVEQEYYAMIERLGEIGYRRFHVFDNFGNHMLQLSFEERRHLRELAAYVRSSRKDVSPAVFYLDVCALTDDDVDVSDALTKKYLADNS